MSLINQFENSTQLYQEKSILNEKVLPIFEKILKNLTN